MAIISTFNFDTSCQINNFLKFSSHKLFEQLKKILWVTFSSAKMGWKSIALLTTIANALIITLYIIL